MNLSMLKQAQEMKSRLKKMQKELQKTEIEVSSGKGAVTIVITGDQKIKSIKISPEIIDPNKPDKLEKMITKAVAEAMEKSQKIAASQMKEITGGLKIPGLM